MAFLGLKVNGEDCVNILIGILVVIACTLLGYVLHGGHLMALYQPMEVLIICGAAFGAMIIANPPSVTWNVIKSAGDLLRSSRYTKELHLQLLSMMYSIFNKTRREGLMAIESDIEEPESSLLFADYPALLKDHKLIAFICDYLRIMMMGAMASHELEALMDQELDSHHEEAALVPGAIAKVADALPGFGIVAAVLGIVITMSKLGGPPEELGVSVAAALVGTLLGILLAYGFVGPFSSYLEHKNRAEAHFYECVKACILASANGMPPQLAVECGRKVLYHSVRPSFRELEEEYRVKK
jgi:chemotaxis protein MotA